jgi:integrase
MASIFKPKGNAKYVIIFTDENGRRRKKTGATDKTVTRRIARDLENRIALRREGVVDADTDRHSEAKRKPLANHLDDFHRVLIAKGNTAKHADLFVDRARRMAALVKGASVVELDPPKSAAKAERDKAAKLLGRLLESARLSDLTAEAVQEALATLKDAGRSLATCDHHRAAIRGFTRWAKKTGRTRDDALDDVSGFNAAEDRRHDRRTLGIDDLRRLIETAERGPDYRDMTGPARALCYRLAVATGLRFSEIKSLTSEAFHGDSVTIQAAYTKNGQTATLNLQPDVADDLRLWVAPLPSDSPVFLLPDRGADMLKIDLEAAGIPYRDASGLVFDFHSLRCQTATLADQSGSSPREVQRLMRHSTLELTDRYTRPRAVDLEAAANALPTLRPRPADREALAATGTDDPAPRATSGAATENADGCNPLAGNLFASSDSRNHNPRVGGSSPSAATCDRLRHPGDPVR